MKRYATCVNDAVGDRFDAWCRANGVTPYRVLADCAHAFAAPSSTLADQLLDFVRAAKGYADAEAGTKVKP